MTPQTLIILAFFSTSYALENLKVMYQWKLVDFDYPSSEARQQAIQSGEFVPENNLPLGLEVSGDRLFVTVPRWKKGVAASLTYIDLKDSSESPKLRPYPNWAAHKLPESEDGEPPEIVSPFRVRADRCGRLWVLDTGVGDIDGTFHVYRISTLLIFDIRTDTLMRSYPIPKDQVSGGSFLANIAVEDEDCENTYAYCGDLGDPGIVVYSYQMNSSWRLKHHYFQYNPLFADFHIAGSTYQWLDGVFGMGLSAPGSDGFSTMYFHPMTGTNEFSVSTRYLHNSTLSKENFNSKFSVVGSRGPNGQSSVSFLHKKSGILFYALVTQNAIACWQTSNPTYTMENQGRIHESDVTMIFPNDIKVDTNDNIWVLSDRLPIFRFQKINESDFNYRIFSAPVSEAVISTACDANFVPSGSSNTLQPNAQVPSAQRPGDPDLSDIFKKFKRPTAMGIPMSETANKNKPPVEAYAVAEIPDMFNQFKPPPPQPQFAGTPDLTFMFKPVEGHNNMFPFHQPTQVAIQSKRNEQDENSSKKGFEFLVNIPVNLYLSIDSP